MPLYEYECTSCERRTEVIQGFSDDPLAECPECGAEVKRLISAPAVQFKGTGWYVTDYGGRKSSESEGKSSSSDGTGSSGGDGTAGGDKGKATSSPASTD